MVSGAAGHGKTELLHTFTRHPDARAAVRLTALAYGAEREVPFGVLAQLFRSARISGEPGVRVNRLLREAQSTAATDEILPQLFHGLCFVLLDLIEHSDQPVIIGIDDVQYADVPSLRCLSAVIGRLPASRLLVVLNETPQPGPSTALLLAELPPEPRSRWLRLEPLTPGGVEALLAERLSPQAARGLSAEIHTLSGGNPHLVRGLAEDNPEPASSEDRPRAVVGAGFRRAVLHCLYRCDPAMLTLVRQLAVLDRPLPDDLLSQLVGWDVETTVQTLDSLNATGIVAGRELRHPEIGAAVLTGMVPRERSDLYVRTADVLCTVGASVVVTARLLIAADRIDSHCAVPLLQQAAEQGLADGDHDLALRCLRLLGRHPTAPHTHARTLALLLRTEWRKDPSLAARRLPELADAARTGALSGQAMALPVHGLMWFGNEEEARTVLEEAERRAGTAQDTEALAQLGMSRLWLDLLYPATGGGPGAGDAVMDAHSASAVSPHPGAVATVRGVLTAGPGPDTVADALQTLYRNPLTEQTFPSLMAALVTLWLNDRLPEARHWADALAAEAEGRSAPVWHGMLLTVQALVALRNGDVRTAELRAHRALDTVSLESWGVAIGFPVGAALQALTAQGRYDEALTLLKEPVPEALLRTPIGMFYLRARGHYLLATGQPRAALGDFRTIGRMADRWKQDVPAVIPWRGDAALALVRCGDTRQARELAQEQLALAGPDQHRVLGATLRVLAAAGPPKGRTSALTRATQHAQDSDDLLELVHILVDLGWAHQEQGAYSKSRQTLRRAQNLADDLGIVLPQRLLPGPAGGTGDRPPGTAQGGEWSDALSDAELRVATLAAGGHSNRQIAHQLFVTTSTVEQHLTRVYRKLNVKNRTDLADELHAGLGLRARSRADVGAGRPVGADPIGADPIGAGPASDREDG